MPFCDGLSTSLLFMLRRKMDVKKAVEAEVSSGVCENEEQKAEYDDYFIIDKLINIQSRIKIRQIA